MPFKFLGWFNSGICFTSCNDLTLYLFIQVLTTGETIHLTKSGKPSKEQLKAAWEQIFAEYTQLSENKQSNYLLSILREYYSIPNKIQIIQTIVDELAKGYNEDLIAKLRLLGFRHAYTEQSYLNDLKITVTQAKGLILKYQNLYNDLERLQNQNSKAEPSDYDLILSELSKYQGYRLDPKVITVSEFCAIVKRFKAENKPKGK